MRVNNTSQGRVLNYFRKTTTPRLSVNLQERGESGRSCSREGGIFKLKKARRGDDTRVVFRHGWNFEGQSRGLPGVQVTD
jgi:hypothetical protein